MFLSCLTYEPLSLALISSFKVACQLTNPTPPRENMVDFLSKESWRGHKGYDEIANVRARLPKSPYRRPSTDLLQRPAPRAHLLDV